MNPNKEPSQSALDFVDSTIEVGKTVYGGDGIYYRLVSLAIPVLNGHHNHTIPIEVGDDCSYYENGLDNELRQLKIALAFLIDAYLERSLER